MEAFVCEVQIHNAKLFGRISFASATVSTRFWQDHPTTQNLHAHYPGAAFNSYLISNSFFFNLFACVMASALRAEA